MDIHPPHGPVQSLTEFSIHIVIVTIGILVAFSLVGCIEWRHNADLVRETKANFHFELAADRKQTSLELARNREIHRELDELIADLPMPMKVKPQAIQERFSHIRTAWYCLPAQTWQTALSTGALAHMDTEEVERYAATYYPLRTFGSICGHPQRSPTYLGKSPRLQTVVPLTLGLIG